MGTTPTPPSLLGRGAGEGGVGRKKKGNHFASLSFSPSSSSRCRVTFPRPIRDRVEIIRESDTDPRSEERFLRLLILHFTLSLHFTSGPQSAVCSPQSAFYTDRLNNISWKYRLLQITRDSATFPFLRDAEEDLHCEYRFSSIGETNRY